MSHTVKDLAVLAGSKKSLQQQLREVNQELKYVATQIADNHIIDLPLVGPVTARMLAGGCVQLTVTIEAQTDAEPYHSWPPMDRRK